MQLTRTFKMITATAALFFSTLAFANSVNTGENDVAIHGYDPVAYFQKGRPVEGMAKYTATHKGAIYRFSSKENRDLFKANTDKYAPQFGGYCAMGVVLNKKLDIDPAAFYIKNDKLYLNLNPTVQTKWLSDLETHIHSGERIWNGIEEISVAQLNEED